jgi:hypothetical protein
MVEEPIYPLSDDNNSAPQAVMLKAAFNLFTVCHHWGVVRWHAVLWLSNKACRYYEEAGHLQP